MSPSPIRSNLQSLLPAMTHIAFASATIAWQFEVEDDTIL